MKKTKLLVNATSVCAGGAKKRILAFMSHVDEDNRFKVVLLKRQSLDIKLKNNRVISLPPHFVLVFRILVDFFLVPVLFMLGYKNIYLFGNFFISLYPGRIVWNLTNIEPLVHKEFGIAYNGRQKIRLGFLYFLFRLSRKPNVLVAQSNCTATLLRKKIDSKVITIYNGVDLKLANRLTSRPKVVDNNVYNIIILGFIVRYKRLERLIVYLFEAKLFGKVKLSIVGSAAWDKEYVREIHELIKKLYVGKFISFYGELYPDEALDMLSRSHALIYTNAYDNCPNVVLEAMSLRVPVIALENQIVKELNDKYGGIRFFNYRTLATDFLKLLRQPSISRFCFSWDDHAAEVLRQF